MKMKRTINSAIVITPFHRVPAVKTKYNHHTKMMTMMFSIKTSIVRVRMKIVPPDHPAGQEKRAGTHVLALELR